MAESDIADLKACSKCHQTKAATREFFSPLRKARDGFHSQCKSCLAASRRLDRKLNPERVRAIDRARYDERRRVSQRKTFERYKDEYRAKAKIRQANKRKMYNANRRAKLQSSETLRIKSNENRKRWRIANASKERLRRRIRWAAASPQRRLRTYIGSAISHALKGRTKGGKSWQSAVGYTLVGLIVHIEKQMRHGMTWKNYGTKWHIDHIRPVSSFHYQTMDDIEFKVCWSLSNLRPLMAKENLTKRAKRIFLI